MKIAFIDTDECGRKYIREILPVSTFIEATQYYSEDFLKNCFEVPSDISQNYILEDNRFIPWCPLNTSAEKTDKKESLANYEKILDAIVE